MNNTHHLGGFRLLRKVPDGTCVECAHAHEPDMPHNQQSLFWQYNFMEQHGRWPTWKDAMEHCSPEMRTAWSEGLAAEGVIL